MKINELKTKIKKVLKKHKVVKAGIFGSHARGKAKRNSDVDILIQPTRNMNLIGFVGVKLDLEDELKKKVDLLSYRGLHPLLKKRILNEEIKII